MTIGEKIRATRKDKRMTQNELGRLCGMSGTLVSEYEKGIKNPKIVTLKKLSNALDVSIHYFLDVNQPDSSHEGAINQAKIYADALDMSLDDFVNSMMLQLSELAEAKAQNREPKILHPDIAEVMAIDVSKLKKTD